MRSTTYSPEGVQQKFSRLLPEATLNRLARESGFLRRAARRCTPFYFVLSFFSLLSKRRYALSSWAEQLAALSGTTLAKQSLAERLHAGSARFSLRLLSYLLRRQHPPAPPAGSRGVFGGAVAGFHHGAPARQPAAGL